MITFTKMVQIMQNFWEKQGCTILPSMDTEVGAGTYHPATLFGPSMHEKYCVQFVQQAKRPQDGREGKHPNRLFTHHQLQIVMQPVPSNMENLVMDCFALLNLNTPDHDIKLVEDDWKNPTLGAAGLGWEVRCNETEVMQFTYFQQLGSKPLKTAFVELAYGLERLAMQVQNKQNVYDLAWSEDFTYGEIRQNMEIAQTQETALLNTQTLKSTFANHEQFANTLIDNQLWEAAYIHCCKMSHIFNLLDAQNLSQSQREFYVAKIRHFTKTCLAGFTKKHTAAR